MTASEFDAFNKLPVKMSGLAAWFAEHSSQWQGDYRDGSQVTEALNRDDETARLLVHVMKRGARVT